jgi:phosphate transport system permease protein
MILPSVIAISEDAMRAVPRPLRDGALALGETQWQVITGIILPTARSGIVAGVILGMGRALGETMAVTMVIGNSPQVALSIFQPQYTMAAVIANEFTEATGDLYLNALVEIGFVLFVITVLINALSRLLIWSVDAGGPVQALRRVRITATAGARAA